VSSTDKKPDEKCVRHFAHFSAPSVVLGRQQPSLFALTTHMVQPAQYRQCTPINNYVFFSCHSTYIQYLVLFDQEIDNLNYTVLKTFQDLPPCIVLAFSFKKLIF
jgi:hypothetical protein